MTAFRPCPGPCPVEKSVSLSLVIGWVLSDPVRYLSHASNTGQALTLSRLHTPCNGCGTGVGADERVLTTPSPQSPLASPYARTAERATGDTFWAHIPVSRYVPAGVARCHGVRP